MAQQQEQEVADVEMDFDMDEIFGDGQTDEQAPPVAEAPPTEEAPAETPAEEAAPVTDEPAADEPYAVDWSKVDPSSIPHEVASKTAAFQGVLHEKRSITAEKQQLMTMLDNQRRQAADEPPAPTTTPADDNELLTRADLQNALRQEQEKLQKKAAEDAERTRQQSQQELLRTSGQRALEKYAAGKVPAGLEAAQVFQDGLDRLMQTKPYLVHAIEANSPDPAAELYQTILREVPEYRAKAQAAANAARNRKLVDQINDPSRRPNIPGRSVAAAPQGGGSSLAQLFNDSDSGDIVSDLGDFIDFPTGG
jgi:hypothetical protein